MPDPLWSVFNAREHESEIIRIVNLTLPLLRQNVATYCMQKHSIEISKSTIHIFNPGQVVDTSDQLVYALSR